MTLRRLCFKQGALKYAERVRHAQQISLRQIFCATLCIPQRLCCRLCYTSLTKCYRGRLGCSIFFGQHCTSMADKPKTGLVHGWVPEAHVDQHSEPSQTPTDAHRCTCTMSQASHMLGLGAMTGYGGGISSGPLQQLQLPPNHSGTVLLRPSGSFMPDPGSSTGDVQVRGASIMLSCLMGGTSVSGQHLTPTVAKPTIPVYLYRDGQPLFQARYMCVPVANAAKADTRLDWRFFPSASAKPYPPRSSRILNYAHVVSHMRLFVCYIWHRLASSGCTT